MASTNHVVLYWIPHGCYWIDEVIATVNAIVFFSKVISVSIIVTLLVSLSLLYRIVIVTDTASVIGIITVLLSSLLFPLSLSWLLSWLLSVSLLLPLLLLMQMLIRYPLQIVIPLPILLLLLLYLLTNVQFLIAPCLGGEAYFPYWLQESKNYGVVVHFTVDVIDPLDVYFKEYIIVLSW